MPVYYRFQHEKPKPGEQVHCFTSFIQFKGFVKMMRKDDPNEFRRMKFWEVNGQFVKPDEGDAVVKVISVREIEPGALVG